MFWTTGSSYGQGIGRAVSKVAKIAPTRFSSATKAIRVPSEGVLGISAINALEVKWNYSPSYSNVLFGTTNPLAAYPKFIVDYEPLNIMTDAPFVTQKRFIDYHELKIPDPPSFTVPELQLGEELRIRGTDFSIDNALGSWSGQSIPSFVLPVRPMYPSFSPKTEPALFPSLGTEYHDPALWMNIDVDAQWSGSNGQSTTRKIGWWKFADDLFEVVDRLTDVSDDDDEGDQTTQIMKFYVPSSYRLEYTIPSFAYPLSYPALYPINVNMHMPTWMP